MNDITGKYKILNKTTWSAPIDSSTEAYQAVMKNPQAAKFHACVLSLQLFYHSVFGFYFGK